MITTKHYLLIRDNKLYISTPVHSTSEHVDIAKYVLKFNSETDILVEGIEIYPTKTAIKHAGIRIGKEKFMYQEIENDSIIFPTITADSFLPEQMAEIEKYKL